MWPMRVVCWVWCASVLLGSARGLASEPSPPDQDAIQTGGNFEVENVLDMAYYEGADVPLRHLTNNCE